MATIQKSFFLGCFPARGSVAMCARPVFATIVAGLLLASCALAPTPSPSSKTSSKEYFSEKEYGVAASPRLVVASKPVPKGGGRYQVGKPYKIKGKTYRPKENPNYSKVGLASWYGRAFHGRKTANGEIYDMGELTAAHPTLPLPSYVRVTNVANKRSVVVRVNDRGPFKKGRIIDVSSAVADMLDFKKAGTAKVKVEYVGRGRMDGRDRQMLLASYKGPNDFGGSTLFASKATAKPKTTILASLNPLRKRSSKTRRVDRSAELFGAQNISAPPVTAPAFGPTTFSKDDRLGPLILQTGFVQSFAPVKRPSPAQQALVAMTRGHSVASVVQIGTFSARANADRVAELFGRMGQVEVSDTAASNQTHYVVRVKVDGPNVSPEAVLAAASTIGIADAFVVSR